MGSGSRTRNSLRSISYSTGHINGGSVILAELLSALRGPVPYSDTEVGTPGVSSDERFGEHDQLGTVGCRLSEQPLRFVESGGSVVEDSGGLDDGSADVDGGRGFGHHVDLREKWATAAAVADWVGRNERHSWVSDIFLWVEQIGSLATALSKLTAEFEAQTEISVSGSGAAGDF